MSADAGGLTRGALADSVLRAAVFTGAIVAVLLMTCVPPGSNDVWLQIKVGSMIWNEGAIPRTVLFTFTEVRDFPFHAHEWLPSIVFYLLHEAFGMEGLQVLATAMGFAVFALAARMAYRLTASLPVALALALAAMLSTNYRFFLRPELFALVFTLVLLNLLVEYQLTGRRRYLAWMAPLALVWANCHGSFPIAIVAMGLFTAGEAIDAFLAEKGAPPARRLRAGIRAAVAPAACAAAMAAATLVNPHGYHLYAFAWDLNRWESTRILLKEWLPTFSGDFMATRGFWTYLCLLAACAAVLFVFRRRLRASDLLLLAAFGYLSTDRQRHIALFSLFAVYVIARLIGPAFAASGGGRAARQPFAVLLAVLVAGNALLARYGNQHGAYPYFSPSNYFTPMLIEHIEERKPKGNVFNSYELGAELIYRYYPDLRPAIDSRADAYGEMYFLHMQSLRNDEDGLLRFIERYDVRYMLLLWWEFSEISTMTRLRESGWRIEFGDHKMVLLSRPR